MASHSQPIVILLPTGSLPNRWFIGANRTNLEIKTKYICKISKIDILLQSTRTANTARSHVQIHQSKIKQVIFEAINTKAPNIHEPGYFGTVCERGQTPRDSSSVCSHDSRWSCTAKKIACHLLVQILQCNVRQYVKSRSTSPRSWIQFWKQV